MFRKFYAISSKSFITSLQFRSEIVVWMLLSIIPTFLLFMIWQNIFAQGGEYHGFSLDSIIEYYVLTVIISGIISSHFENKSAQDIREGKIDFIFTKPISYFNNMLFKSIGRKMFYWTFSFPFVIFIYVALTNTAITSFSIGQITSFLFLMGTGYITEFLIALIIVLFAFWYENASGLVHFKWIVITLFSGAMIPFAFMPESLQNISMALPFKYLYAVPIAVIQQDYSLTIYDFLNIFAFIIILRLISHIIWRKAVYKYTSAGG